MTQPGAPAAYRGYRLQALYILKRILRPGSDEYIFQPEGCEDLDILDNDGIWLIFPCLFTNATGRGMKAGCLHTGRRWKNVCPGY